MLMNNNDDGKSMVTMTMAIVKYFYLQRHPPAPLEQLLPSASASPFSSFQVTSAPSPNQHHHHQRHHHLQITITISAITKSPPLLPRTVIVFIICQSHSLNTSSYFHWRCLPGISLVQFHNLGAFNALN